MNVRQHIECKADKALEEYQQVAEFLEKFPLDLGDLEVDSIFLISDGWLCLQDSTHKDLGAKLATLTDQSLRFTTCGSTRTASFYNVGPFHKVDLDRPNPKCRKVRVRKPAKEEVISICGDIPEGFELLEELDESV